MVRHQVPRGHIYEGTRTTYRLLERASKVEVLPDRLMFHRTRPGSLSQSRSLKRELDFFLAAQELEGYVMGHTSLTFTEEECDGFLERKFHEFRALTYRRVVRPRS